MFRLILIATVVALVTNVGTHYFVRGDINDGLVSAERRALAESRSIVEDFTSADENIRNLIHRTNSLVNSYAGRLNILQESVATSNEMINTDVSMQVLSPIPALFSYWAKPTECEKLAKFINDYISNIVKENPLKYFGLGTLPMQDTDKSLKEMDRCINTLQLNGIEIGTNINGKNLSSKDFDQIFKFAEELDCPIFIHPWDMLGQTDISKYWLPWLVGMPAEITRAMCSLIFGGVMEKYPKLKIAFAHGGGSFPFTIGRIDKGFNVRPDLCAIDNNILPSKYIKSFYVDSLVHSQKALKYIIDVFGIQNIALGSDYPFPLGENSPGSLIESLNLSNNNNKRLFHGTALEWLGLNEKKYIQ